MDDLANQLELATDSQRTRASVIPFASGGQSQYVKGEVGRTEADLGLR
jgi:hypothetical protein